MFQKPFSFEGRIRRPEHVISFTIYFVAAMILNFAVIDIPAIALLYFPILWFLWAQNAKRCHDLRKSGWYQLIPFYGFWLLFAEGEKGANEYGPDPKVTQPRYVSDYEERMKA